MKELKPLIELISRNKLKRIEVAGMPGRRNTHLDLLFDAIATNKFENEEEAATFFFKDNKRKAFYFQRLKRQLAERLVNTVFFIDATQPGFNDYQRAYYNCYKNVTATKILLGRLARAAAIPLAEQTLKKALEFEFTDLIFELSKTLMANSASILGDPKKYKEYLELHQQYSKVYWNEVQAEQMHMELMFHVARSSANIVELSKLAIQFFIQLEKTPVDQRSYRFHYHYYSISSVRFELANDYPNTLKIAKQALVYFDSRKDSSASNITYITSFLNRKLACHVRLGQFREGEATVQRLLSTHSEGSLNWYNSLQYYIILCFHSGEYQKTLKILHQAMNQPAMKNLAPTTSEYWSVLNAFVHYFITIGKIKPEEKIKLSPFKITKFLNEVPTFSKDKRGTNISILILEVLFLLHQKKFSEIIDRVESLNMYVHRYLKKDDTFRSNCFIKMLLQLPLASFHRTAVIRKAKKYADLLQSMPLSEASQSAEVEIVPYEVLWEYVLLSLDDKIH